MPRDLNLVLTTGDTAGQAIAASTTGTAINLDGGEFVQFSLYSVSNPTGTAPTLDLEVQLSFDSGTTWVTCARFPQLSTAANKGAAGTRVAMAAYVPRANVPNARGTNTPVKARWKSTVGGTTPSFTLMVEVTHLSGNSYGQMGNTGVGHVGQLDNIKNFVA